MKTIALLLIAGVGGFGAGHAIQPITAPITQLEEKFVIKLRTLPSQGQLLVSKFLVRLVQEQRALEATRTAA